MSEVVSNEHVSAESLGLSVCHNCKKLHKLSGEHLDNAIPCCATCGTALHFRKPESLSRTWALLITSMILMIPANMLPIMTVVSLGTESSDTILSGVIFLAEEGMVPIALVVFIASIFVPVLKLISLTLLLLTAQNHWDLSLRQSTVLFRMVHFIGRWSMLDLFVISVLVTLVDLGNIATITGGAGATAFGGVIVATMLAANTFDSRLIWDKKNAGK